MILVILFSLSLVCNGIFVYSRITILNIPDTLEIFKFDLYSNSPPSSSLLVGFDKPFYRTIIGFFYIIGEKTGWELTHSPMISYTLAANTFSVAGFIGAIAFRFVFFNVTLSHDDLL